MPNILTPAQECARIGHGFDCTGSNRTGDVRKCKHGRYWMFQRYPGWMTKDKNEKGYWGRIDWFQNPVTWWRAHKALKASEKDC